MSISDVRSVRADDAQPTGAVRHGAYICISVPGGARQAAARAPALELAARLGLRGEFEAADGHPREAIAFLRRVDATPADIEDTDLLGAEAVVHVAAPTPVPVSDFCAELTRHLGAEVRLRVLAGGVRPKVYTGVNMYNFAYAHQVVQQPAGVMPNAFLVPLSKTGDWWQKGWMERHTYFLPRYDDAGRMLSQGHALAAEPGIRGALRDVAKNPEWKFVREGPTWHGRRVASWREVFD